MPPRTEKNLTAHILEKAISSGATLAGIAPLAALVESPSHRMHPAAQWPSDARSVLVLALAHREDAPELDWWGGPGGTQGNRSLSIMLTNIGEWLRQAFRIESYKMPYQAEDGGVFLKDAAALAGLGIIGRNNLLLCVEHGPRVRLRASLICVDLEPTGILDYDPCGGCDGPCWKACPRDAFAGGSYSRSACNIQMEEDVANRTSVATGDPERGTMALIKYCRACELACPVGK